MLCWSRGIQQKQTGFFETNFVVSVVLPRRNQPFDGHRKNNRKISITIHYERENINGSFHSMNKMLQVEGENSGFNVLIIIQ